MLHSTDSASPHDIQHVTVRLNGPILFSMPVQLLGAQTHVLNTCVNMQKSLGEDTIRKHLPAALGGAGPIPGATRPEGTEALAADAAEDGSAQDGNAAAAPPPIKMESNASEPAAEAAAEQGGSGVKRSLDAAGSPDGGATKTPRTRRDSDSQRQNGTN